MRFRKSIGLGMGVRMNVNKGSVGMSFGVRGARYSMNSSGRRTTSVGIPGTGLYSIHSSGGGRSQARSTGSGRRYGQVPIATTVTADMAEQVIPRPGPFAAGSEKSFRAGLVAYLQQNWELARAHFEQAVQADSRNLSDDYFLAATYVRLKRQSEAVPLLERIVAAPNALPDALMAKYIPGTMEMQLPITEHVSATVGFDSIGATLVLAEVYQELGRKQEAIGLVQQVHEVLPDDDAVRLSLADLLYDDDDFRGLVELTQGVENRDDVTLATLHLRAKALANEGLMEPAVELLSSCLRRTAGRDQDLLKEIRYNRAEAYELLGDKRKARADWSKLVAEDAFYRNARERLQRPEA
jgi:tetratricopeptide (TPR) repeat protein